MADGNDCSKHLDLVLKAAGFDLWENDVVDGRITKPATKVLRELGYEADEFVTGMGGIFCIIHPDDVAPVRSALEAHVTGAVAEYRAEFRIRAKSGDWVWYANYGKIIDRTSTSPGRRLVGVSINIDERKRRERELEHLNAQLLQQNALLQELATTDQLTGIANRRRLLQLGESEVQRAHRLGHALALLILDIDDFKEVNDAWGHLNGDHVIRRVASICARCVRANVDMAGRLGGEEFAIILPEVSEDEAMALAERLRGCIEAQRVELDEGAVVARTVSIGAASLVKSCDSFMRLLAAADRGLYTAKQAGKNCVRKGGDA